MNFETRIVRPTSFTDKKVISEHSYITSRSAEKLPANRNHKRSGSQIIILNDELNGSIDNGSSKNYPLPVNNTNQYFPDQQSQNVIYRSAKKTDVPKISIEASNNIEMFRDVSPLESQNRIYGQKIIQMNTAPNFYKNDYKQNKLLEVYTNNILDPKKTYDKLKEIIINYENQIENLQLNLFNSQLTNEVMSKNYSKIKKESDKHEELLTDLFSSKLMNEFLQTDLESHKKTIKSQEFQNSKLNEDNKKLSSFQIDLDAKLNNPAFFENLINNSSSLKNIQKNKLLNEIDTNKFDFKIHL